MVKFLLVSFGSYSKISFMFSLASTLGSLFFLIGLVLSIYGLSTDGQPMYEKSLGWNLNLIWGGVMFVAGCLFYLGGHLSKSPK
ncbi:hypothetical protein P3G55_14930 [Leptospira sp. 96542]|nr:hypothetical protein [Leptospira sp. 96542]